MKRVLKRLRLSDLEVTMPSLEENVLCSVFGCGGYEYFTLSTPNVIYLPLYQPPLRAYNIRILRNGVFYHILRFFSSK